MNRFRPSRRAALLGGAALAGCAAAPSTRVSAPAAPARGAPAAVLVHGAWHGGWCWRDVAARLRGAGWRVFTPTLTGLGERRHLLGPEVGVETHVADVANLIEAEELERPVLVGHSYGGMIVEALAGRLRESLGPLVFLDACVPDDGENFITQNPAADGRPDFIAAEEARLRAASPDGVGVAPLPAAVFGIPPGSPQADWVNRRLTPHPLRSFLEPARIENGGSAGLNRIYAHCISPRLEPSSIAEHGARLRDAPGWRFTTLPTGHDAMVTRPDLVAALIDAERV